MEAIVAVFVVGALALGLWGLLNLREGREDKIDHPKMWLEACRRIQKAVDEHSSGRLKMETIEDKDKPYGGKISVLWCFINERPEQVLSIRYLPEQPEDEIVIRMYSSKGKAFDSFSQEEFADFLGGIEEQIFNYESPLSGGGDKSHKL
jgi:hypothetical protein